MDSADPRIDPWGALIPEGWVYAAGKLHMPPTDYDWDVLRTATSLGPIICRRKQPVDPQGAT